MKSEVIELLSQATAALQQQGVIPKDLKITPTLQPTKDKAHGDLASNLALMLAKPCQSNPRQLAEQIIAEIPNNSLVSKIDIAGPGFLNFFLQSKNTSQVIADILDDPATYGHSREGHGKQIYLEFVSSNPTGPLHVGHGRGAAYGASVGNLLEALGYEVHREYYVNDAGRQMRILALSIWFRYLQRLGENIDFPLAGYQGDYVNDLAAALNHQHGEAFLRSSETILAEIPSELDSQNKDQKDAYVDACIRAAINLLGEDAFEQINQLGLDLVLSDIKEDLAEFGVAFDHWFHESSVLKEGWLDDGLALLKEQGYTYEKEGALWFKATALGDEKDRVLIKKDGYPTYFATDTVYHLKKLKQNCAEIIDVFGSDHHGYVPRMRAYIKGLGYDPDQLTVELVQFVSLYRGKEKLAMSTRKGSFVTLRELRNEVGNDAARYFYIMRKIEQPLDFDLALAKSKSNDNPVFYIQYAHARISSCFNQLQEKQLSFAEQQGLDNLEQLGNEREVELIKHMNQYVDYLQSAAKRHDPHMLANYLHQLASLFHSYYNAHQFIIDDEILRNARLCLVQAVKYLLKNGLLLLGVSAPEKM